MDHLENLILREDLARILLVGHSYGGAVIHGLEARLVDRIRAVVHLEGAIPAPDASVVDGWRADYRQEILALAAANRGWRVPPPGPAMWIGLSAEQQRWLRSQLTAQSLKTFQDTMPADLALSDRPHYHLWARIGRTTPIRPWSSGFVIKSIGRSSRPPAAMNCR